MPEASPVIRVENVTKVFSRQRKQISLRHEAGAALRQLLRRSGAASQHEPFYALRDISFEVDAGESVALIGRNGSGKSTLLRVMARIMRPTSGRVTVEGRFTALIGLGAGFIPTMTGRENVYLNAAIHGVPPQETDAIIEDIIAFADLGDFMDSPVKDYSSGMNARLGFSVAVHILPEIIFLDEVLAVGDASFQNKCIQRIQTMKEEGKTIIFVSHSANAVRTLCERALWLDRGRLRMDDSAESVLTAYEESYGKANRPKFDSL